MNYPEQEYLNELLDYQPNTGYLFWKHRSIEKFNSIKAYKCWNSRYAFKKAGMKNKTHGYIYVGVDGKQYLAHRLIWIMVNEIIPSAMQIDHINHIRSDNRIDNLRLVTCQQNRMNTGLLKNSLSDITGVHWCYRENKWRARIKINRKNISLGYYNCKYQAINARKLAERKYNFHENHGAKIQYEY
jgi:hypothetical protein